MNQLTNTNSLLDWKKPEGKTGTLVTASLLAGLGIGLFYLLPFIITLLSSLITAIFLLVVVAGLIYVITDKKIQAITFFLYKKFVRGLTGIVVEMDPIAILKIYINTLGEKHRTAVTQLGSLNGQIKSLESEILDNKRNIEQNLMMAGKAKEKQNISQMVLKSKSAKRLEQSNLTYTELLTKMQLLYRILTKLVENSAFLIEDLTGEVEVKEREFNIVKKAYSVMKSVRSIINGDPNKLELFEMAMETTNMQVANQIGEIDQFMSMSKNIMDGIDLKNGVYEEEGLKMLEAWEAKADNMLMLDQPRTTPLKTFIAQQPIEVSSAYKDFLK